LHAQISRPTTLKRLASREISWQPRPADDAIVIAVAYALALNARRHQ